MRDLLYPEGQKPEDSPIVKAQKAMARRPLPKRFYNKAAAAESGSGFEVHLDGKPARTPAKNLLALPTKKAAELIAAEFEAMTEVIDPSRMPATRIANSAIDGVAQRMREVRDEIVAYASSDLVCFRSASPVELVARQSKAWDPVVAWAKDELRARFVLTEGVMHVDQDPAALQAVKSRVAGVTDPIALASLNVLTTISGSALIALMAMDQRIAIDDAWAAATVDERWSAETWGEDAEAAQQLLRRKTDFIAAHALMRAISA
jgi:chaperone required for assembly of F1-ATPase